MNAQQVPETPPPSQALVDYTVGQNGLLLFLVYMRRVSWFASAHEELFRTWLIGPDNPFPVADDEWDRVESHTAAEHEAVIAALAFTRSIDLYLRYLKALMGLIFRHDHRTLRHLEDVRAEVIVGHETIEDVYRALADFGADYYARMPVRKMFSFFKNRLDISMFPTSESEGWARRVIELRNLLVHDDGVVDAYWQKRLPDLEVLGEERILLEVRDVLRQMDVFESGVLHVDAQAVASYALPEGKLPQP